MCRFMLLLCLLGFPQAGLWAQDTLKLADIREGDPIPAGWAHTQLTTALTGHTLPKHLLRLQLAQRFGEQGAAPGAQHNFLGLDHTADMQLAALYGLSNRLTVGLARSSVRQLVEGQLTMLLYRQKKPKHPFSITYTQQMGTDTRPNETDALGLARFGKGSHRISYAGTLHFTRRMHQNWTLMLAPGWWHRNYVNRYYLNPQGARVWDTHSNALLSAGLRWQACTHAALMLDYTWVLNPFYQNHPQQGFYRMPWGMAVELGRGSTRLQLQATNAASLSVLNAWQDSPSGWDAGGLRMGFRLTHDFWLKKPAAKMQFEWSDEEMLPGD
jgi:hypothetical protein